MKIVTEKFKSGAQFALGFLLVLSVFALFCLACYSYCPSLHYRNAYLPKDDSPITLKPEQLKTLNQLVSKGLVISASDLYNDTISFYSTLITWLIGILGISGVVSFVYIRYKSKEEAEDEAHEAVERYHEKASTRSMLEERVEAVLESRDEDISLALEKVENFATEKVEIQKNLKYLGEQVELLLARVPPIAPFGSGEIPPANGTKATPPTPPADTPEEKK